MAGGAMIQLVAFGPQDNVLTTQPVNGVSTTLPSTALQQSDLQFDSPYSNYSLYFDGSGDKIILDSAVQSTTNKSVSAWVYVEPTVNQQTLLGGSAFPIYYFWLDIF